jgi:hypothetical protein
MAKASLTLQNGTLVMIEGTALEIHELLTFYGAGTKPDATKSTGSGPPNRLPEGAGSIDDAGESAKPVDLIGIVNYIKSCDAADRIEKSILDKTDQLPRVLLPLYVVHEHMQNNTGLTSGDISKVTAELGIRISVANASTTLSKPASKYVIGDKARRSGQPVRYKLSRRGHAYMKDILMPKAQ